MLLAGMEDIDPTLEAADKALEESASAEPPRAYLGMSQIGDACSRKLWYSFRFAAREKFNAKTLKRFADGHRTEALIIDRLKQVKELEVISETVSGNQIRVIDHGGNFSGHLDGTITGLLQAPKTTHVLEIKCCEEKKFNSFVSAVDKYGEKDALWNWDLTYYAQAQCYMRYTGFTRHYLVVATAGGRDWKSARTEFQSGYAAGLANKAKMIIESQEPPERESNSPAWWKCKICTFKGICHEKEMPDRSCRTCLHSEVMNNGRWHCQRWGRDLKLNEQVAGCPTHKLLPSLVHGEIQEVTDKGITYKLENGEQWYDGE